MIIYGLNKTTLLDYPGHLACTIFTGGCNFRCVFCHNSDLIFNTTQLSSFSEEELFSFLKKRKRILQGVCISGGEPTLCPDLLSFISKIKDIGYLVKLDTNGSNPDIIYSLIHNQLIDMVAMDIKASPAIYPIICDTPSIDLSKINSSINLLMTSNIDYEFRSTVVDEYFSPDSIHEIGKWLKGANAFFLQKFNANNSIKPNLHSPSDSQLNEYCNILRKYIPNTNIRGA